MVKVLYKSIVFRLLLFSMETLEHYLLSGMGKSNEEDLGHDYSSNLRIKDAKKLINQILIGAAEFYL